MLRGQENSWDGGPPSRAGTSAPPSPPGPVAPGLSGKLVQGLCWHLPPRDTYISVPISSQRLRQLSVSDQHRDCVQDGDRPPEGPRRTCASQPQPRLPSFLFQLRLLGQKQQGRRVEQQERLWPECQGLGAPLAARSPETPKARPFGRRAGAAAGGSSFARGRQKPYGNHWVPARLVQHSTSGLCPFISPSETRF